jgi:hypothetical protein
MKPKKLLLFAVVAALAAVTTLPVAGQGSRQQVQGTWFGTGTSACLVAAPGAGFNPNLTPTDGVTFQSSSVQGTLNINADGTGTGEFHEFVLAPPPVPPPGSVNASSNHNSISFTYTIADDGTLTVVFSSVTGTLLTGPNANLSFTVTPPPLTGRIGRDGKSMMLSSAEPPTVETLHITGGPSFQRLCYRSRVFVPIHVDGED